MTSSFGKRKHVYCTSSRKIHLLCAQRCGARSTLGGFAGSQTPWLGSVVGTRSAGLSPALLTQPQSRSPLCSAPQSDGGIGAEHPWFVWAVRRWDLTSNQSQISSDSRGRKRA